MSRGRRAAAARIERPNSRYAAAAGLVTALVAAMTLSACAGSGLGEVLGGVLGGQGPAGGAVVAEIRDIDTRNRTLDIYTEDGQQARISYDDRTRVIYQNQQYPVSALERGDVVEMAVQETSGGYYYTDQIVVRRSVSDRGGDYGNEQRVTVTGEVRAVDVNRGMFELTTRQGTVIVTLPYNPPSSTVYRFERLRRGDDVRIDAVVTGQNRVELVRFVD